MSLKPPPRLRCVTHAPQCKVNEWMLPNYFTAQDEKKRKKENMDCIFSSVTSRHSCKLHLWQTRRNERSCRSLRVPAEPLISARAVGRNTAMPPPLKHSSNRHRRNVRKLLDVVFYNLLSSKVKYTE